MSNVTTKVENDIEDLKNSWESMEKKVNNLNTESLKQVDKMQNSLDRKIEANSTGIENVANLIIKSKSSFENANKSQGEKVEKIAVNVQELATLQKKNIAESAINATNILELVNLQKKIFE